MLTVSNVNVTGWEAAIRGMRSPMNSWDKSDSGWDALRGMYIVGKNDLELMTRLANAGDDHGKFMRFIHVSADVIAPLYWWKGFDTYKIGTVSNSCSTMHKIHAKPIMIDDFSVEDLDEINHDLVEKYVAWIEAERIDFIKTGDKKNWRQIIQMLPSSYNQKRTIDLNYQVLRHIYHARKGHKLSEWSTFCDWIETLPYSSELITK